MQRLPRYELLLSKLLEYTPADHLDYSKLVQAKQAVKVLNDFVNENKRKAENMQKIMSIQNTIYGLVRV